MNAPSATNSLPGRGGLRSLFSRLVSGASWAAFGRLGGTIGLILVFAAVARLLPPAETGLFVVCHSTAILGSIISIFGMGPVVIRMIRTTSSLDAFLSLKAGIRRAVLINLTTSLIVAAAMTTVIVLLSQRFAQGRVAPYLGWVMAWMVLSVLSQITGEIFRGLEHFKWTAVIGGQTGGLIVNPAIALTAWGLIRSDSASLRDVLMLQVLVMSIVLAIALFRLIVLLTQLPDEQNHETGFTEPTTSWFVREAWPIAISQVFVLGIVQVDILILGSIGVSAAENAAMFAGVRRLMMLVAAPLQVLNLALSPFVAELFATGQKFKLETLLRFSATVAAIPSILVLLTLFAAPAEILAWCYEPAFRQAAAAIVILATANVVFVLCGSCRLALNLTGNQHLNMWNSLSVGVLYLATLPILIHTFGLAGAAAGAAGHVIIANVVSTLLVKRRIGIWTTARLALGELPAQVRLLRQKTSQI